MVTLKKRIYFADRIWPLLHATDYLVGGSASERVNEIVLRYDALYRHLLPDFTREEWCAIMDANNGTIPAYETTPETQLTLVWANLADSEGMDEKWGVDCDDLVRRLRELSAPQSIAVVEAVYRFWSLGQSTTDEALRAASII